jgi:enamine deaminase RidA (YjgF/YER057c/UK114 family)
MNPIMKQIPTNLPTPLGAYSAVVVCGGTGHVSGQFPIRDGQVVHPGILGTTLDLAAGREAARVAAWNVLGQVDKAVAGGLDAIELVHVCGCIASVPGFQGLPQVLDAASETFVEVLGERGRHARGLIPVAFLPNNAAIELLVAFNVR